MSDTTLRAATRDAAGGDPTAIARLRKERCRAGECCAHRGSARGFLVPFAVLVDAGRELWGRRQLLRIDLTLLPVGLDTLEQVDFYVGRVVRGLLLEEIVPSGTIAARVWDEPQCRALTIELCNEKFPQVAEGELSPVVPWDETTTNVELPDGSYLSGPSWWVALKVAGHL